jgi:hypothetical protein
MLDRKKTKSKTQKDLEAAGYRFEQLDEQGWPIWFPCKGCGARIVWAKTARGKRVPFDVATFDPHWANCPEAKQFRKPKMGKSPKRQT